jgi:hypothetical protein
VGGFGAQAVHLGCADDLLGGALFFSLWMDIL